MQQWGGGGNKNAVDFKIYTKYIFNYIYQGSKTYLSGRVSVMVLWVMREILHGAFINYSQCSSIGVTKGHSMCYPVCWMVHIKYPLLLIEKSKL